MPYTVRLLKWGTPDFGVESGPIRWTSELDDDLTFDTSLYELADFEEALRGAAMRWESVAAIDFVEVDGTVDVDIRAIVEDLPGESAGQSTWYRESLPGIDRLVGDPDATLAFDSEIVWAPYGGEHGYDFYAVALHEFGHLIGLAHVNDPTEVMNPTVYVDDLGTGDIAWAQTLYGRDPEDEPFSPEFDPTLTEEMFPDDGGGGGGGAGILALLLGVFALVFGAFGGLGGALAAAARLPGRGGEDDHGPGQPHDVYLPASPLLSDLLPMLDVEDDEMATADEVTDAEDAELLF